jgi:hypothetical protein
MRALGVWLAVLLATTSLAEAQSGDRGSFVMQAVKAGTPPVVDGVIGELEWAGAARGENFVQLEPSRGAPAELRTVVLVLYDESRLYVAFQAYEPEAIVAQMTQRDAQLWNDDSVHVFLDTFHDGRSGYYFMANVLGTQADGRVGEDGGSSDTSWDAPWVSAGARTDYGYAIELAIPFEAIQYVAGPDETWGINFARTRRRSLERSYWAGPVDHWGRLSQAGDLEGLDVRPQARRHQIVPYVVAQAQDGRRPDQSVGVDLRYALTPQTSAYATINPDFATVEADQEEINLTRFEVSLSEKRQFFLEGQELFNQRIRTFYSRRIADITGGAKVLGRQGPWSFAFLTTRGDLPDDAGAATYVVGRLQRDVSTRSNVALMVADRQAGGRHQGSVELDANLFFTQTFGMTAQLVRSYGAFGSGSTAFFVRPSYDSSTAHAHIRYTHLGDGVADNINAVGFILDDDRREVDGAIDKTFWPARGAAERIDYGSNYNAYWAQTGTLRSWQVDESLAVTWRSRWITEASHREEFQRFERDFRNRQTALVVGFDTRAGRSGRSGMTFGRNFDADFTLWSAAARSKVTDELSVEYELQRLELDPDPDEESTWIHVVRADHFFTPDLYAKLFFQTNSAIDRRNLQAVFVYRYLPPFGTFQVAYQRGTAAFGQRSDQGHTLFLKLTTVL